MRAIVLAYHGIGCVGLQAVLDAGIEVVEVITHRDEPGEVHWFDSVAELAAGKGLPVQAPEAINHPYWVERIRTLCPDYIFSFYYRQILGAKLLSIPLRGCFNLHGSLLPRYRGRAPVNWAILNGETRTGVTLHHMTEQPDRGDIVGQLAVDITPDDTAITLHEKLGGATRELLGSELPRLLNGTAQRTAQDDSRASYFGARTSADGEIDWSKSAREIVNLVRALPQPYPGAFTHRGNQRLTIWSATAQMKARSAGSPAPGTVIRSDPLTVQCGDGELTVAYGQLDGDVYRAGNDLAREHNLISDSSLGKKCSAAQVAKRQTRVLILGVNGFIGNALTERLLHEGGYEVHGLDLRNDAIERFSAESNFYFHEGDLSIHREWIEYQVKNADVVLPLVAIATPREYVRNPLGVFELDFEENLRVVRYCAKYRKRLIFPSTSEVYGMCDDENFDERTSRLVLGPISKQRWIYACSKQLLDRVIWAYGDKEALRFTLFRPFNWIGPRLDNLDAARIGSSRAITQLIVNLVDGTPIELVDGGRQKRCFTDVQDGVECLFRIILNENRAADGEIINIGDPNGEASIGELATMLSDIFDTHPLRPHFPAFAGIRHVDSRQYYGDGYEDVQHRRPNIDRARALFGWEPKANLTDSIARTLDFFMREHLRGQAASHELLSPTTRPSVEIRVPDESPLPDESIPARAADLSAIA